MIILTNMWYILAILLIVILLFTKIKIYIKLSNDRDDDDKFVALYFRVYKITFKKLTYSRDTIINSFKNVFIKRKKREPGNFFDLIIELIKDKDLKIEKFDCKLNFTTEDLSLIYRLAGISHIINKIVKSIAENKKKDVSVILTVNKNESYIKCIIYSYLGKIIILLLQNNKNFFKKGRKEYASTSN